MNTTPRYEWVDFAKGICMFAVVTLYSGKTASLLIGDPGLMQYWADFAKPFRMPDFFLLSGLFLARAINRDWLHYIDKKVIHYSYFFLLWTLINVTLESLYQGETWTIKNSIVSYWAASSSWPFKMMWFIQMLPAYFLFTKVTGKIPVWVMFPLACILHTYPPIHSDRTIIGEFWNRYVFFYAGYAFSSYFFKISDWISENQIKSIVMLLSWIIINSALVYIGLADKPFFTLALGFAGASAIIAIATLIQNISFLKWVEYLGKNSIVVYLAFYWPMVMSGHWLMGYEFFSTNSGFFTVSITVFGLLGSLSMFWLVGNSSSGGWLFSRPAWATIYKNNRGLVKEPQS